MKTKTIRGMSLLILGCLLLLLTNQVNAQTERWIYLETEDSQAFSNVFGGDGNIYVTGNRGTGTGRDITVISLDDLGNMRWVYDYDGSAAGPDEGKSIVYGEDDNIYAVGFSRDSTTLNDIIVISLDTLGNEQWIYTYDGSASGADEGLSIAYGGDGNIYVAGFTNGAGTSKDFTVVSIDNTGHENWTYIYDGSASGDDEAFSIIYGADGNIYAAGYSTETGEHDEDFMVVSIDDEGDENWTYHYNGSASSASNDDRARSIVYGLDGYLYAAGFSTEAGSRADVAVIKLDLAGNERWTYKYDGLYDGTVDADGAHAIIYGTDDNLYVAGYSVEDQTYNKDFAVMSVDTAGNQRWVYTRHGSGGTPVDMAYSLVYGVDDCVYATGYIDQGAENDNFIVVSLDTIGQLNWFYKKDGGGAPANQDQARSIAYNPEGYLYAAGYLTIRKLVLISLDPRNFPDAWVSPTSFYIQIDQGETTDRPLRISNIGEVDMDWTISEKVGSDWLSVSDTVGTTAAGDTVDLTVYFDATTLIPEHYYDTLVVSINNPYNPESDVLIHLWVKETGVEEYPTDAVDDRCEVTSFFNKQITLNFTNPSDMPCEIALYDILGARVYNTSIPSTPSIFNLDGKDISRLSNGVYFLLVSHPEKGYPVKKLVKF